jgi:hypothetical protein
MPTDIDRQQVQTLLEAGAQLIEVLPAKVYSVASPIAWGTYSTEYRRRAERAVWS